MGATKQLSFCTFRAICWECWHFSEWCGLMDGYESSMKGTAKKKWDILECKDGPALHYLCWGEFVCAAVSKGKCRWRCQGWMIAVVFSALWGGSDGCDGWLAAWPPSSALCLEIWAGIDSGGAGLLGGCMSGPHEANFICTLKKKKTSFLVIFQQNSTVKSFLLNKIPFRCHC